MNRQESKNIIRLILASMMIGFMSSANAATVGHPASSIREGTFGSGDYAFSADVSVAGNVSATFFIGDGSLLSGIGAGGSGIFVNSSPWTYVNQSYNQDLNISQTVFLNQSQRYVGIGTASPDERLHVSGNAKITGNLSLGSGIISYNESSNKYIFYNGTVWQELGTASSSGSSLDTVPYGTVSAFYLRSCPTGWAFADGTQGTPDLRGRMIIGNGTTTDARGETVSIRWNQTGGEFNHTLTVAEMPSHTHDVRHANIDGTDDWFYTGLGDSNQVWNGVSNTRGDDMPHNNLPPYYSLIYCMKIGDDSDMTNMSIGKSGIDVFLLNTSDNFGIGTTTPGEKLDVNGNIQATAFFYSSDVNLKKDINRIENPVDIVKNLEGVTFNWKENNKKSIGFIAQDVEKVVPELVNTNPVTGLKSVEYANIVAIAVEAIKEQQKIIENQQIQIDELKKEIDKLR